MKSLVFSIIFFFSTSLSYANDEIVDIDISSRIEFTGLGYYASICQGQEVTIILRNISISTTNTYFKWASYESCNAYYNLSVDYNEENNSLVWAGDGLRSDPTNRSIMYAKPNSSGTFSVEWNIVEFYPANACRDSYTKTYHYFGISRRLVVIPKPSPPNINPDKVTLRIPESTIIRTGGCANTLEDENYPGARSLTQFAYGCIGDDDPVFNPNMSVNESLNFNPGLPYYAAGINHFYAKCNDNGCLSDEYSSTKISVQAGISGDEVISSIDETNAASGRTDYHMYETSGGKGKEICTVGPDNPNCTKEKVFELLLSSKDNQGPIASDFARLGSVPNFFNWQQIGSNLIFSSDSGPILNGDVVNLPGFISLAAGIGTLYYGGAGISRLALKKGNALRELLIAARLKGSQYIPLVANPIRMLVDNQSFSVTNYTLPDHFLYPGKVVRTVAEECGKIKLYTIGVGYSWLNTPSDCIIFGDNCINKLLAFINETAGTQLFESIDSRFKQKFEALAK